MVVQTPAIESSDRQHTVAIVDDISSNLTYFKEALETFGYQTMTAENGKEALEKIMATVPDLVLSDVNMPEMNGYELCEALKGTEETRDVPIILVTAQDDRDSLIRGLEIGADDFLIKPVNLSELQARVRNLLIIKDFRDQSKVYTQHLEDEVARRTSDLNEAVVELKSLNVQLKGSIQDTIQRLSTAAEYRDNDTASHIWRMSHYSKVVAKSLGLSRDIVENVLYSSPMHDVGKIGTPDHILLKRGKLTPDEKQIMDAHTTIGESILSGSDHPLLVMAREVAGNHHEWWNGEGYPRKIRGEEIPLTARIVAVADVYDALTTKRVYKDAWSIEDAFRHLEEGAGTHFDPTCVGAILDARDDILAIQNSTEHQQMLKAEENKK